MAKDSLARGARSATFLGGTPEKDAPIEFHGTVAEEEDGTICHHGVGRGQACFLCDAAKSPQEPAPVVDLTKYQPMNDRVLLRKVEEHDDSRIIQPEAFARKPNKAEVIAVGEGMLIGGQLRPIMLAPGDIVYYGEYNAEDIEVEGVKLMLVSAFDVRLKVRN